MAEVKKMESTTGMVQQLLKFKCCTYWAIDSGTDFRAIFASLKMITFKIQME